MEGIRLRRGFVVTADDRAEVGGAEVRARHRPEDLNLLAQPELRLVAVVGVNGRTCLCKIFDETRAPDISGLIPAQTPEFSVAADIEYKSRHRRLNYMLDSRTDFHQFK
jgi:hypothetical protein